MAASTTLTVRLPSRTKQRLGRLAQRTKRTRSFLAGEAIAAFVEHELDVVDGIERGLADMKAARVVPHEEAMARIRKTIRRASGKKPAR
ncbi:MAG TPA: CopG family ribbon-helix-helix protein [Pseudolabrys sp.]|nr:CopG family ribbon-helix-helix protein [Pseudolabrys sp.]